jgi:hypothetical protein
MLKENLIWEDELYIGLSLKVPYPGLGAQFLQDSIQLLLWQSLNDIDFVPSCG